MKKFILLTIMLFMLITAGSGISQTNDTTVSIDKGIAKIGMKYAALTNRIAAILGLDTVSASTLTARLIYMINAPVIDTTVSIDKGVPKIGNKRPRVTNRDTYIFGQDTTGAEGITAELVYLLNALRTDEANTWTGVQTFDSLINNNIIMSVTYAQLATMIGNSTLIEGQMYLINDFATKHYYLNGDDNIDTATNTATAEPLVVKAVSTNKLSQEAFSPTYPDDILYYDWNPSNWTNDSSFSASGVIITGFKGVIYYRYDTKQNVETYFDFRGVKNRRWKLSPNAYSTDSTYSNYAVVKSSNKIYFSKADANNNNALTDTSKWALLFDIDLSTSDTLAWKTDFSIKRYIDGELKTFTIPTGASVDLTTFKNYNTSVRNIKIGRRLGGTIINNISFQSASDITEINIGQLAYNNTIVGSRIYYNTWGTYFYDNLIVGGSIFDNYIESGFFRNTIATGFAKNRMGVDFFDNTCDSGFYANDIGVQFQGNSVGKNFARNRTEMYVVGNIFGNSCINNVIGQEFTFNIIGDYFQHNKIGSLAYSNQIGQFFTSNLISSYFYSNVVGDYFQYNLISSSFNSNTIGTTYIGNHIGNAYSGKTIGNGVTKTIDGVDVLNLGVYSSMDSTGNIISRGKITTGENFDYQLDIDVKNISWGRFYSKTSDNMIGLYLQRAKTAGSYNIDWLMAIKNSSKDYILYNNSGLEVFNLTTTGNQTLKGGIKFGAVTGGQSVQLDSALVSGDTLFFYVGANKYRAVK